MPVARIHFVCKLIGIARHIIRQRVVLPNLHDKPIARFLHHSRSDEQLEHTAKHTLVFR